MRLLTATDIAKLLQMAETYVRDVLSKRSDFPSAIRIGNSLRWDAAEINDWIESRRVTPASRRSRSPARRSTAAAN